MACPAQEHRDRRRSFLAPRTGPGGDGPAARRIEDDADVLDVCREHGVSYVPYFPLGSAFSGGGPAHLAADPYVGEVAATFGGAPVSVVPLGHFDVDP